MSGAELRERRFRLLNRIVLCLLIPVAAASCLLALRRGDSYAAAQAALGLVMFSFPALAALLPRVIIPQDCRLLYAVFVFCTVIVGSSLYGYSRIPYWDKLFHFLSGLLISAAGFILCQLLFHALHGPKAARGALFALFPFLLNLAVAALWEVYEYLLYVLFGVDAVNNATSGVHDTMQDMIVCLIGGILFSLTVLRWLRRGKRGFLLNVCAHCCALYGRPLEE